MRTALSGFANAHLINDCAISLLNCARRACLLFIPTSDAINYITVTLSVCNYDQDAILAKKINAKQAVTQQPTNQAGYNSKHKDRQVKSAQKKPKGCLMKLISKKKWYWYVIVVIGTVILFIQLWEIGSTYFEYLTVTEVLITVPENLTAPALSLCLPYFTIITEEHMDKYRLTKHKNKLESWKQIGSVETLFTIEQVSRAK